MFRILGPLEVRLFDRPLHLRGDRQRRLLAVLLLNPGTVVSFERLAAELWADPPPTARRQTYNVASSVRRTIAEHGGPPDIVRTMPSGYLVSPEPGSLDSTLFHDRTAAADRARAAGRRDEAVALLRAGLELWRGPALDGLTSPYIDSAAARLGEKRLSAQEKLFALRLEAGESAALIADLRELVEVHPLRESLRVSLMLALFRAGRRADALVSYQQGRKLLAEELGLDPGVELRKAHEQILRGTAYSTEPDPKTAPTPAAAVAQNFLVNDSLDFTGRDGELAELTAHAGAAPRSAPLTAVISGMGGVGKTALAIRLAHRIAPDFPDGTFFVDLHGFTAGIPPVTPEAALAALLRQAGIAEDRLPPGVEARADLWRSRCAGRRLSVILDNATDAEQIRPLLAGGPGSLVVITSRRHLVALEDAVPMPLDVLPPQEAAALFGRIAGTERVAAEPGAVAEAVALCGGLPLAIRIAASRLRHRPTWTVAHLVELLGDGRRRGRTLTVSDRGVTDVLALSLRHLPEAPRRAFGLLGLSPGADFDACAAAAILDLPLEEAEAVLEELLDCNLLMQRTQGRYQFHDLARDCARELVQTSEDAATLHQARHRLFDYYLHLAYICCTPVAQGLSQFEPSVRHQPRHLPRHDSESVSLDTLSAEHVNLIAVARAAGEDDWHEHAWQLPCLLLPYFTRVNYRADALGLFRRALRAARALGDRRAEAAAGAFAGLALRDAGRYPDADAAFRAAIEAAEELGDPGVQAWARHDLAISLVLRGDLDPAHEHMARSRVLAEQAGDHAAEMSALINLGVLGVLGTDPARFDEAEACFRAVLDRRPRSARRGDEARALLKFGWMTYQQERFEESAEYSHAALAISREIGSPRSEALAQTWLSAAQFALGNRDEALARAKTAIEIARRFGLREVECDALINLGEGYLSCAETEAARAAFEEAEPHASQKRLPFSKGRVLDGLAHVALASGDQALARAYWERATAVYPVGSFDAIGLREHLSGGVEQCRRCRMAGQAW
jgi:DNA-binding SARP family transcriptional activator